MAKNGLVTVYGNARRLNIPADRLGEFEALGYELVSGPDGASDEGEVVETQKKRGRKPKVKADVEGAPADSAQVTVESAPAAPFVI